ncbi:LacI family DNA-binding transcriptional regulator [Thermoactinospora rubra]|uniref:LacI family DNA-binding transcriptional regulator n=1 Tax=Thermoactinospora rubra TaxID=1088767 RepID=UPI000A10D2F1|nr:LacI family DNA-binding transcriptional regulator [Thermoactinospora rubra]
MSARVQRPTLKDVAREAGVSIKTVSRALNDEPRISAETRRRVLQVVDALGFRPNVLARHMRAGARDRAVGLVIPDLANPFFGSVAGGVESVIRDHGLTLVVGPSDEDPERERFLVTSFLDRQPTALLVVPTAASDHEYLRAERRRGLPIAFIDRPPVRMAADCVVTENFEAAREGVTHLIGHGHRRIAFVGDVPADLYTRQERFRGYRAALEAAGLRVDPALVADAHRQDDGARVTGELLALPDPPTAIFAANNFVCMGALTHLSRARRRDVALVGFDDFALADAFDPGVTVLAQDTARLGVIAAERALARLAGDRSRARTVRLPARLIARGSGEIPGPLAPRSGPRSDGQVS